MATRSFDISRRLSERGHPTTIFTSNFSHYTFRGSRTISGLRMWETEDIEGVELVWLRTTAYRRNDWRRVLNMVSFSLLALLAGARVQPRPDAVVGVSVHPLAALAGWAVARLRGARFYLEITDLWPETLIEFGQLRRGSVTARALRALERFLFARAQRILMLWRHTDDYVESLGVSSSKIVWVPHGVEPDRYRDLRPYQGGRRRPFTVMYLGGFVSANAVGQILAAARILQERGNEDVGFKLVGSGTDREQVIAEAERLGLRNVEFPSAVPKIRITEPMGDADAFIYGLQDLPLYRFGISLNKLTDYLAGGRPIIFFGRSTYDPVRAAGAGYSVPPDDPVRIADAIEQLLALGPSKRRAMGERGRAYMLEHHSIPKLADRFLEAIAPAPAGTRIGEADNALPSG
jgi:glycosyltransferase involved in cell wall biosynthesis